ncbi:putative drug exporter of the RND superfamily [Paenibacillus sp. yr247]|uniref:MMPL family transporter n=1 Tax=Paenibacillus sp. yr247 TaxID=1761880 RepID=UPI000890F664|nr:MMPL family transporter [Paenibacillus sp. yr247]SDP17824.1 putative drug exporter of the RND superfamily [Paenibacillus sp. yr247]
MIEKWVRALARTKWLVLLIWLAVTVGSVFVLPDLGQIVRQTESKFLPTDAQSAQAQAIIEQMDLNRKSKSNAIVVVQRESGLTEQDQNWIKGKLAELKKEQDTLGIVSVLSAFDDPSLAQKFISKDNTTELVIVEFPKQVQQASTADSVKLLKEKFTSPPSGMSIEFTGSAPIFMDYNTSTNEGLKKTEILTLVLVLGILLFVFRSPIAPFIPLLTIGMAFILTRGFVALFSKAGMPVSSFTETFLIAVLFGAGTDYCILLIHRFREELSKTPDRVTALLRTIQTVGKTVLFSGSTVLIAFFLIGFAKFGLYQSAVGVAIGVAVTLVAAVTLTPALMLILGPAMYWPVKVKAGAAHGDSKLWGAMARLTAKRPIAVLLVCMLLLTPFVFLFQGNRSFDDLAEIDPSISAVKGFREVEAKFSSGEVLPTTVVITSNSSMRTPEGLAAIEKASQAASQIANVKEVRSAARPLGKQIAELTVPNQLEQTNKGLTELRSGINQVSDGFKKAQSRLEAQSGDVTKLSQGAEEIAQKLTEVQGGLKQVSGGIVQSEQGAQQLVKASGQLKGTAASMGDDLSKLVQEYPELAKNITYQTLVGKQQGLTGGLVQTEAGLQPLAKGLAQLAPSVNQISGGIGQLADGQKQVSGGIQQLENGFGQFASGLGEGTSALTKVSDGISQVVEAQKGIADNSSKQIAGWNIPKEVLEQADFKKSLDFYMSADGKIAKLEVVLAINPYSKEAMGKIDEIKETIVSSLNGTSLSKTDVKLAGQTSNYHELDSISQNDFYRTGGFVLIGIYLVLALLLRSLLMPLYLLLSLVFNYLITMGIVEFIFVKLLGFDGLSWTVSFFIFLIIVALGVDYSIFLMARFKEEYRPGRIIEAMGKAMTTTGGVIMSAALIMGGTFAALMFSGVDTLLELGAGISIGLAIYTTVFMGLIVPSLAILFGEANWWPFPRKASAMAEKTAPSRELGEAGEAATQH